MDIKKKIIELLDQIHDEEKLRFLYKIVKAMTK